MSNVTSRTLLSLLLATLTTLGLTTATTAATAQLAQPVCGDTSSFDEVALSSLPPEAGDTVELVAQGGPYPFPQDGTVFQNREDILPDCPAGYYHEYTVITPGSPNRGARRIVTGEEKHFYTDDHYASFALVSLTGVPACGEAVVDEAGLADLPAEVADTIALVERGGPFQHEGDGTVYQNREGVLPACPSGYYHLYTVPTPGAADRGDRRLIAGGDGEYYYTPDRYATFFEVITG